MKEFRDKVAVVTGGASGMGFAMAQRFAAAGMKLAIADIEQGPLDAAAEKLGLRQAELAEQVASEILSYCLDVGGSLTGEHGIGSDKACLPGRIGRFYATIPPYTREVNASS